MRKCQMMASVFTGHKSVTKRQILPTKTSANVITQIYIEDKNKLILFLSVWLHLQYFSKINPFTLFNISSHLHEIH